MTEPLRLGVVGCARILPAHLRGLLRLREAGLDVIRVTALSSRTREGAAAFQARGQGPEPRPPASSNPQDPLGAPHLYVSDIQPGPPAELFLDWRRLVESPNVDAVLILAPVALHHEVALAALAAGKHVLIEKPFAISVRAARAIVETARAAGLVAGVAENLRYAARSRALSWVVAQGMIGTPQLWLSGGIGGEWAPDRIVAHTPWRHRKLEGGGGPAIDLGVHLMHQIRMVMGPVEEVSGLTRTLESARVDRDAAGRVVSTVENQLEDLFLAQLRFRSGAVGSVFASWAGRGEGAGLEASPVVYGSAGCLKGSRLVRDDGLRGEVDDLLARGATKEAGERWFPVGIRDSFALELLDFARAAAGGPRMEADGEEGLLDLASAFAILESASAGRPVQVAEVLHSRIDAYQQEIDERYHLS